MKTKYLCLTLLMFSVLMTGCTGKKISLSEDEYKGTFFIDEHNRYSRTIEVKEKKNEYELTLKDVEQQGNLSGTGTATAYEMPKLSDTPVKIDKNTNIGEKVICRQKISDKVVYWHQFVFEKEKIKWRYVKDAKDKKEASAQLEKEEYTVLE